MILPLLCSGMCAKAFWMFLTFQIGPLSIIEMAWVWFLTTWQFYFMFCSLWCIYILFILPTCIFMWTMMQFSCISRKLTLHVVSYIRPELVFPVLYSMYILLLPTSWRLLMLIFSRFNGICAHHWSAMLCCSYNPNPIRSPEARFTPTTVDKKAHLDCSMWNIFK